MSESFLFRLFKRELHQTPLKYIREKRLMLARKMLSEEERPTAVCTRCGFSDYTTFYRNYVGFFGCRPRSGRSPEPVMTRFLCHDWRSQEFPTKFPVSPCFFAPKMV